MQVILWVRKVWEFALNIALISEILGDATRNWHSYSRPSFFFLFACPGAQPEATEQLCHLQKGERYQPGGKQEAAGQEHEPPTGINANAERKGEAVQ